MVVALVGIVFALLWNLQSDRLQSGMDILIRKYIEPVITSAKEETFQNYKKVGKLIKEKAAVQKLFREIGPQFKTRPGCKLRHNSYKTGRRWNRIVE